LAVALLDAGDFGGGTSWNSLKTVHGGLRHLQRLDLAGLRESARERTALLRIAPGLVRPLPFLVPTYAGQAPARLALAAALRVSDLLTPGRNRGLTETHTLPAGRTLSPREFLERQPLADAAGLTGGVEWTDAQVTSTERLLLAFLHEAAEAGAVVANYTEVRRLQKTPGDGIGVSVRDVLGGGTLEVRGRAVVAAAGPGVDAVLASAGLVRSPAPLLYAANLVLGRDAVATHAVGAKSRGRFLFLVPWRGRSILGTAYAASAPPPAREFLDEARQAFPWAGLQTSDVTLVHRGRVPGDSGAGGLWTRSRVRAHQADGWAGLVSILAVKYTTARAVAERAVDAAARRAGRRVAPCRTALTPLPRAVPLQGPLPEQVRRAVREEEALHLEDAVLRRLDLGTAGRPSPAAVDEVEAVMAAELGWDASRRRAERERLESALQAVEAR
jgi:glycerol-3-phosphate dehydrogenase